MDLLNTIVDFFLNLFTYLKMMIDASVSFITSMLEAIPYMAYASYRIPIYINIFPRYIYAFMMACLGVIVVWQFLGRK